jgi:predicted nucleic acid-binding protein
VKRVFVDTSAFFAHLVAEDAHHDAARALFERADRESWTLITSNAVVWEAYTLIRVRARNGRELALGFLQDIQDGICDVERVRPVDEMRAIDLLRRHTDKRYSFCDALSFVVMEPLGIEQALAFDSDFKSYGKFVLVS